MVDRLQEYSSHSLDDIHRRWDCLLDVFDPNKVGRRIAYLIAGEDPHNIPRVERKRLARFVGKMMKLHRGDEDLCIFLYSRLGDSLEALNGECLR